MNKKIKYTCYYCGGKYSNRVWKEHIKSKKHIEAFNKHPLIFLGKDIFDHSSKKLINRFSCLPRIKMSDCNWRVK